MMTHEKKEASQYCKKKKVFHADEFHLWDGSEKDARQLSAQSHALELFFSFTWLTARRLVLNENRYISNKSLVFIPPRTWLIKQMLTKKILWIGLRCIWHHYYICIALHIFCSKSTKNTCIIYIYTHTYNLNKNGA